VKSSFQVLRMHHGGRILVKAIGELDADAQAAVGDALGGLAKDAALVVEMADVTLVDTVGIGFLVPAIRTNGPVTIMNPSTAVLDALERAGLRSRVRIEFDDLGTRDVAGSAS
jgi:anti-anti-sigma factor